MPRFHGIGASVSVLALFLATLNTDGPALASEVRGRVSFGFTGILPEGADAALRFLSRLELEVGQVLGDRGSMSVDVEGRQSDTGLNTDAVGVRELSLRYQIVRDKLELEAGRVDMAELEGLLVDGLGVRWHLSRRVSLEMAGGVRNELGSLYGSPDSQRPGFGMILRADSGRNSAQLGFSELRSSGNLERRFVTGSAYGGFGKMLSGGGHVTVDFGQPGQSAHVTSVFVNGLLRPGRIFDLSVSYGSSSGFFSPEYLDPNLYEGLPEDLRPTLPDPTLRFGPRLQSLSVRGQISPVNSLSLYADARIEDREGETERPQSLLLGTRLKLGRLDRSRLRIEVMQSDRPAYGIPPLDVQSTRYRRWRAGATHSFGNLLEVEAIVSQTFRADGADPAGETFGGLGGELNATLMLGRHFSILGYYALEASSGPHTQIFLTQLSYRF